MSDHAAHHHSESHHVKVYLKVFGALLVLTVLTVLVSLADLGPLSLPVAMVVALMKATLVSAFFMHLKDDERFNTFIFLAPTLFLALLFAYFYVDINGRDSITAKDGNFVYYEKKQDQFRRANPLPSPEPPAPAAPAAPTEQPAPAPKP